MKKTMKFLGIAALVAVIGFSVIGCDNGAGGGTPNPGSNQTPVAGDYNISGLSQTAGSVTAVSITAKSGKSPGVVYNIRYNNIAAIPQTAGSYSVIFDVGAAVGWNPATDLFAGTLVVDPYDATLNSINGIWVTNDIYSNIHTIDGSTGVYSHIPPGNALFTDALNKGFISIGGQSFRDLTRSGFLTWIGQKLDVMYNPSSPDVAVGVTWMDCTLTLNTSSSYQTIQVSTLGSEYPSSTLTKGSHTIEGVWESNLDGNIHTIYWRTGVYTHIPPTNALFIDALNKGFISIGGQSFRDLTSSGLSTWTGQILVVSYNTPDVATTISWLDCTLWLSSDGQTIQVKKIHDLQPSSTLTRKQ